ncbi:hypothetical protein RI129_009121 [Pyrocoelia pectoralis]|uniref:Uncharacterized protein n=1 Tax=Pyrocoelia pectoralis TaxID=417401 RepID=A0AAN7VB50_9COLE
MENETDIIHSDQENVIDLQVPQDGDTIEEIIELNGTQDSEPQPLAIQDNTFCENFQKTQHDDVQNDNTDSEAVDNKMNEDIQKKTRSNKWDINKKVWSDNKNKKRRERGKKYLGRKKVDDKIKYDIQKENRKMKPRCNCKRSLSTNSVMRCNQFTENDRTKIFQKFWKTMDWGEKKVYIRLMMEETKTIRYRNRKDDNMSKRKVSILYSMNKGDSKLRVCKNMFLNTHIQRDSEESSPEFMSRKQEARMLSLKPRVANLEQFFESLPKMESHYCRSTSKKLYLEPIWTSKRCLHKMYCNVWCVEKNIQPLSIYAFEKYFDKNNLGLFMPRKDQCETCIAFKTGNIGDDEYHLHRIKKQEAQVEKEKDKNSNNMVFTVDVQAVLLSPRSNVSSLYFRTKLITHNYTLYNLKSRDGYCFLWNETEGGVTADNFASIMCKFLIDSVIPNITEGQDIIIYSDGCCGQNRNVTLANAFLTLAKAHKITIIQKYLEVGHTQMEVDGMHATIERKLKNVKINVPADYMQVCLTARENPKPYNVQYLDHTFFKDFREPVVTDLRALKYVPNGIILYKLRHTDEWKELQVTNHNFILELFNVLDFKLCVNLYSEMIFFRLV